MGHTLDVLVQFLCERSQIFVHTKFSYKFVQNSKKYAAFCTNLYEKFRVYEKLWLFVQTCTQALRVQFVIGEEVGFYNDKNLRGILKTNNLGKDPLEAFFVEVSKPPPAPSRRACYELRSFKK